MKPLIALVAAAALTGCAGTARRAPSHARSLFAADCAECHSLRQPASTCQQGGSLGNLNISRGAMLQFVAEMPTPHRLDRSEVVAVAAYVLAVEHASR